MNKYKKLLSNTFIFAIGTFSSKVLVFLLMPLYSKVLSPSEFGITDLVLQTGNLLLPLVSLGIVNAVIRFGLDRTVRKSDVFSTGLAAVFAGFLILLCFYPLVSKIDFVSDQTVLMYLFVLMSSLRSVCSQFVRAKGEVRLYAFDGVLSTATTILFNVLYLVQFHWGVMGYLGAIVSSDTLSVIFLFLTGRLYRHVRFKGVRLKTVRSMLKYAIPMIPNTMFWWVINVSDRYVVSYYLGDAANGLYAVACKIPSIVTLVASVFLDAWQMSAITEEKNRSHFFTKVAYSYTSILFMASSLLIVMSKVIVRVLTAEESYFGAWQYIPLLVLATVFSCLVNFLASVYMVKKNSLQSMFTMIIGAVINVVLNFILVPIFQVNGAAFATFFSYFCVFLIRATTTQRYIRIHWSPLRMAVNTILLLTECFVMIFEPNYWIWIEIAIVLVILKINFRPVFENAKKLLRSR